MIYQICRATDDADGGTGDYWLRLTIVSAQASIQVHEYPAQIAFGTPLSASIESLDDMI